VSEVAWNQWPKTVEEVMLAIEAIEFKEVITGQTVSPYESIVLTNELMKDICRRIIRLEADRAI